MGKGKREKEWKGGKEKIQGKEGGIRRKAGNIRGIF
jgi:hypothetical protein